MEDRKQALEIKELPSFKDVNNDVQLQLEKAQSIVDYLQRINDNQHTINDSTFHNDYLASEIGNAETALVMLNEFIDSAVALLRVLIRRTLWRIRQMNC